MLDCLVSSLGDLVYNVLGKHIQYTEEEGLSLETGVL